MDSTYNLDQCAVGALMDVYLARTQLFVNLVSMDISWMFPVLAYCATLLNQAAFSVIRLLLVNFVNPIMS